MDYAEALEPIRRAVSQGGYERIYLASDEKDFVARLRAEFEPQIPVETNTKLFSSGIVKSIHHDSAVPPYDKAFEALLDCLYLTSCGMVLKTPSCLSAFAKVFRPEMPVYLLARPNNTADLWFPDREIPTFL